MVDAEPRAKQCPSRSLNGLAFGLVGEIELGVGVGGEPAGFRELLRLPRIPQQKDIHHVPVEVVVDFVLR